MTAKMIADNIDVTRVRGTKDIYSLSFQEWVHG
jgi:hypothetical protein